MHTPIHTRTHPCIHARTHTCTYPCMHTPSYAHTHAPERPTHARAHAHMHTSNTHAQRNPRMRKKNPRTLVPTHETRTYACAQAGCLGEIVRQTKGSMLCPRIWLQEPTPKSTVWRGSQNSEWGSAAEVCFSRELQQLENPTLAFFKAEQPSLDVRTKFGGIDAKKSYKKNWGRLGVCSTKWAPARQNFFLWNTRKFSGAFPHEQPAPKNRISKQAAQLTPGCSVGSWRGCVLHVVTQTCHSSATQQPPPHLPLAGGEFPVTPK